MKLAIALTLLLATPALADTQYLVFNNGAVRSTQSWSGSGTPPANAYAWTPTANSAGCIDQDPADYLLSGGSVILSPVPAVPYTGPTLPNMPAFMSALIADTTIPNNAHASLAAYVGILQALATTPSALQLEWSRLTATDTTLGQSCTDTTGQTVTQRVQQYAATYNVKLVP